MNILANIRLRTFILTITIAVNFTGCVSDPAALRMRVEPDRAEYVTGQPVRLRVTMEATTDKCVALQKKVDFDVTIDPFIPGPDGSERRLWGTRLVACGMGALVLWPLAPVFIVARVADVADLRDTYEIVKPEHPRTFDLIFYRQPNDDVVRVAGRKDSHALNNSEYSRPLAWPAGTYDVTVQYLASDPFLPPIGWKPYHTRLSAKTKVRVLPRPTTTQPAPL